MRPMRWIIAECMQETNTFSPLKTDLSYFQNGYFHEGQDVLRHLEGTSSQIGAFIDVAYDADVALVPLFATNSCSGGPVDAETFDHLLDKLKEGLENAPPSDGILLSLHGAMVSEKEDDVEGAMLELVRQVVGPDMPIICTLDLHGHVTEKMVRHATALVGYKTYPHVDMYETGVRAAELLHAVLRDGLKLKMSLAKARMIVPADRQMTAEFPMKHVMDLVTEAEEQRGIYVASAFPVQPWLDVPQAGFAALVVADSDNALADQYAERIARRAYELRDEFFVELMDIDQAIDLALASQDGPVVFGDSGDAPSSGSPGDNTSILKALLKRELNHEAMLVLVDPEAVDLCEKAGVGQTLTVSVGGKRDQIYASPVQVTGTVKALTDGRFRYSGPGFTGVEQSMGKSAVLQVGTIFLVLISQPVIMWDPAIYRSVGLDPARAKIVFVKSPNAFRAFYGDFAHEMHTVASPGVSSSDILSLKYVRISPPTYPFGQPEDELF